MKSKSLINMRTVCAMIGLTACLLLNGCSGWLASSGSTTREVVDAASSRNQTGIQVVDLSDSIARKLASGRKLNLFSETLLMGAPNAYLVGPGDVIEVSVWEAPPGTLF